ncbi:MAG: 16S rRNA (uracil(1498)-N(3))-methyltransferase [Chitinophagaceae bacterium]|nr:16S rRNA (uracil(1498)-N(3))-methyltransferase [Chitinophagaceae bacterium]
MQLPFFYDERVGGVRGIISLSAENSKYIAQVLRMKPGERIILTDGKGAEVTAEISMADKRTTEVTIIERKLHTLPEVRTAIGISLLKNENRLEWFVEKATELGISAIILLQCERTEKKSCRTGRLESIMVSAMLQSRQFFLPKLTGAIALKELINDQGYDQRLIAHCIEERQRMVLKDVSDARKSRLLLIGPEGDFSPDEVAIFEEAGFIGVSLGHNRLRTETAGIAAAVLLVS